MERLMKNLIKTIAVNILAIAALSSNAITANPEGIARLQSFAANAYGFIFKYPILTLPGLTEQGRAVASCEHAIKTSTLTTISKEITFDENYFYDSMENNNLKRLVALAIHEHTHLYEDHAIIQMRAEREGKTPNEILQLRRNLEERADAGVRQFPDLCLDQYDFFMKSGDRQCKQLEQELLNQKDRQMRAKYATVLSILNSKNPELIKTIEFETHPYSYRRALYFKKWAEDGGLKNI